MKTLLSILFLFVFTNCFAQNDSGFSVYANAFGNGSVYSVGLDYESNLNFPVLPGIQIGGGFQNAYTRKGTYSIPLRANLHFAEYGLHHWIIGGGVALTDGINNTDDDFTQTNVSVGFGSILYHKDIQPISGAYFRTGFDFTNFMSGDVGAVLPVPNFTAGFEF